MISHFLVINYHTSFFSYRYSDRETMELTRNSTMVTVLGDQTGGLTNINISIRLTICFIFYLHLRIVQIRVKVVLRLFFIYHLDFMTLCLNITMPLKLKTWLVEESCYKRDLIWCGGQEKKIIGRKIQIVLWNGIVMV